MEIFDRQEQSFINPSSLLKDDEVIAEAQLIENSENIEYAFNPEQPIKLEKDANKSWGLKLFLPKVNANCKYSYLDLIAKKAQSN